ncbi:MAG TPA: hypothetical protein VK845_16310 [Gemmatimonadales bacterium]|nr:hypothetical protein [Gemmatimonadales bacterium]
MLNLTCVRPRRLAATVLAIGAALVPPAAVSALCISPDPDPMTYAEPGTAIFVGTVAETQAFDQNALIRVEDVWWGGPMPEWQEVWGVATDHELWSTSTRFKVGSRYLVVAERRDGKLWDMGCVTRPYSDRLAARAPDDARDPVPAKRPASWGLPAPSPPWPVIAIGVLAPVIGVVAWRTKRRGQC